MTCATPTTVRWGSSTMSKMDRSRKCRDFAEQGPDVLDDFSFDEFTDRLKGFHGEIKGVLTRGRVISGIGNAYADEILFDAMVYPFKRRKALSNDELQRIYRSSRSVIENSIEQVRERMGDRIDHKVRDFLLVHNRGGQNHAHAVGRRSLNSGPTSE